MPTPTSTVAVPPKHTITTKAAAKRAAAAFDRTNEKERLKLAAEKGDATAQLNLGFWYSEGGGGVGASHEKNHEQAAKWYKLAADQGHADAIEELHQTIRVLYPHGARFCREIHARGCHWFSRLLA